MRIYAYGVDFFSKFNKAILFKFYFHKHVADNINWQAACVVVAFAVYHKASYFDFGKGGKVKRQLVANL